MITKVEYLKRRAVEILEERIERRIIPVGDVLPDIKLTTFQGQNVDISKFYSDKPLLLMFFGGSW
jgi:hypothetical protein